jgi:hypothetical protein
VLDEWFFAVLTKSANKKRVRIKSANKKDAKTSDAKTLKTLIGEETRRVMIRAIATACPCVQCDVSKAAQADASSPEFSLQRSTPAVMNQIACPSTTRPKPCTLSSICPERTPRMVREPRMQP